MSSWRGKPATGLIVIVVALALPACSGTSSQRTSVTAGTEPPGTESPASLTEASVDLSGVCPDPLVIQTDWAPESEYGGVYGLLGDDYTVDRDRKRVTGSLTASGQDTGIDVEIRAGGGAISGGVSDAMYFDDSVTFGFGSTDGQILRWGRMPLLSVVAPLEINPQMIMWDPQTYPDVETLAGLGEEGVTVNVFGGPSSTFSEVLVAMGVWNQDQIDPSYDGSTARFIAEDGAIAQYGWASDSPYLYEHILEEWGKPVAYQTMHDAGFQTYTATLAIRPDDLEVLRPCLDMFVPIVQQSVVDFVTDPARTNAAIVDIVARYNTLWQYDLGHADYSVQTQLELGITGNGPDDTIGNFDEERIATVLQQMRDAGIAVPADLEAADLFTNEFIDESVGLDS